MTYEDFLESLFAKLRKGVPPGLGVPDEIAPLGDYRLIASLVEQAHIFFLEDDPLEVFREIQTIAEDVYEDLKGDSFPCPFDNMAVVQPIAGGGSTPEWHFTWLFRLRGFEPLKNDLPAPTDNHFLLWQYGEGITTRPDFFSSIAFAFIGGPKITTAISSASIRRIGQARRQTESEAGDSLGRVVAANTVQIAAMSHPANYIVERTPQLTPREERRVAAGQPRPDRKRKHYIVIDHDELVELNPATRRASGTHASPVPHARRGHWRRLAERCTRAKAEGKTKVWVGDTYVGEREFGDEKNRYRVLLPPVTR